MLKSAEERLRTLKYAEERWIMWGWQIWQTLIYNTVSSVILTRVIFHVRPDRMRWLAGYGYVVCAAKYCFDS